MRIISWGLFQFTGYLSWLNIFWHVTVSINTSCVLELRHFVPKTALVKEVEVFISTRWTYLSDKLKTVHVSVFFWPSNGTSSPKCLLYNTYFFKTGCIEMECVPFFLKVTFLKSWKGKIFPFIRFTTLKTRFIEIWCSEDGVAEYSSVVGCHEAWAWK